MDNEELRMEDYDGIVLVVALDRFKEFNSQLYLNQLNKKHMQL